MVADPGGLLDHDSDAGQGPVVGVEAVRTGALAQRLLDAMAVSWAGDRRECGPVGPALRSASSPPWRQRACQRADVLAGNAKRADDIGLGVAGGKQRTGLHADAFERLAVAQAAGVAAVGGWSHTAMLPGQPRSVSSEGANLFNISIEGGPLGLVDDADKSVQVDGVGEPALRAAEDVAKHAALLAEGPQRFDV